MRRAALFAAPLLWTDALAAKVAELAAHDPDPGARAEAQAAKARGGN